MFDKLKDILIGILIITLIILILFTINLYSKYNSKVSELLKCNEMLHNLQINNLETDNNKKESDINKIIKVNEINNKVKNEINNKIINVNNKSCEKLTEEFNNLSK